MSKPDAVYYKVLEELQVTNERLDRIANALEGIFSVLAGNDEQGLDGILPVIQRLERKLEAK
jgi:hypothetical protein